MVACELMGADAQRCARAPAAGGLRAGGRRTAARPAGFPGSQCPAQPRCATGGPQEQVRIFLSLEKLGWDLLAIYHSHPNGPDHPSPTDLAEAAYPETVYLIWFPREGEWACRGFFIHNANLRKFPFT